MRRTSSKIICSFAAGVAVAFLYVGLLGPPSTPITSPPPPLLSATLKNAATLTAASTVNASIPAAIADGRPRVIFYQGCSGSSATSAFSRRILQAHGLHPFNVKKEFFKPEKNRYWGAAKEELSKAGMKYPNHDKILLESIRLANNAAQSQGDVLFFFNSWGTTKTVRHINALFGGMLRSPLDKAICDITDCFGLRSQPGVPVFAENGTQSNLCFQRRKHPEVKIKVRLDTLKLVPFLKQKMQQNDGFINKTYSLINPSTVQYNEDLFKFEYTPNNATFEKSLDAWHSLLRSMVNPEPDKNIIREVLQPSQNSRPTPKPHKEIIVNFDEVEAVLRTAGLDNLLRI